MKNVTPYKDSKLSKKEQVSQMFDNVSENYDSLNKLISFGMDKGWRKKVIRLATKNQPQNALDIATGTGDLAIMLAEKGMQNIVGLDISPGMLEIGKQKIAERHLQDKIEMVLGDSENIPFTDHHFDAITVSFGIRNFEHLEKGFTEIHRVLKPGGTFVILETSVPEKAPFKQGYSLYTKNILPLIGKLFSKDKVAYGYLSESASVFPYGEKLVQILEACGFAKVEALPQMMGTVTIYHATKS